MRVSRFTQFSLVAIATVSTVLVGLLVEADFREASTGVASAPLEALSQELTRDEDIDLGQGRSRPGDLLRSLNLSRRQKRQLFNIRNQYQSDIRQRRQTLQSDRTKLRDLMISDAPNPEVSAQFTQVQNSHQALYEVNFESYLKIRDVLTLEQRQIFSEQLQARRRSRLR